MPDSQAAATPPADRVRHFLTDLRRPGARLNVSGDTWSAMYPPEHVADALEAWALVEALRAPEANEVRLVCDNPDFNGQPNSYVECTGAWTGWTPRQFRGDTVLGCLRGAATAMAEVDRA